MSVWLTPPTPPLQTRVYAGFGSTWVTPEASITWTDITSSVLSDQRIRTKRGRDSITDTFNTGTLGLVLANNDRRFDKRHATGPYFEQILPGVPIKVTMEPDGETETTIARGYVPAWPQQSEPTNTVATVPIDGIRPEISNTVRTLRMVYTLVDHGVRLDDDHPRAQIPHRDLMKAKLVEVIRAATPYYF